MANEPESPLVAPSFTPQTDVPLVGQDALDALQQQLEAPTTVDLVVTSAPPTPVGKSYAFDWLSRSFVKPAGQLSPKATHGMETLIQWIVKCLHTARGAHPIHPRGYGLAKPQGGLIGTRIGNVPPDLEERVRDALTFHPNITDVREFSYRFDPDDVVLEVDFRIILNDQSELLLTDIRMGQVL